MYINNFNNFNLTNEGLIRSYGCKEIIDYLLKYDYIKRDKIWSNSNKLYIEFDSTSVNNFKEIYKKITNIFGWFLSYIDDNDLGSDGFDIEYIDGYLNGDIEEFFKEIKFNFDENLKESGEEYPLIFIFEQKFGEEYIYKINTLYHVTELSRLDNIFKQGLVSKRGIKKSIHPSRIYLSTSIAKIKETNITDYLDREEYLEIDNTTLNIKLYKDVNMPGALYTTDNIPPIYIKRIYNI